MSSQVSANARAPTQPTQRHPAPLAPCPLNCWCHQPRPHLSSPFLSASPLLTLPSSYQSPGIYICTNNGESDLFMEWLAVPHPGIHIAACFKSYQDAIPTCTPELQAEVASTVTAEQEKRFVLCEAKFLDTWMGWSMLAHVKQEWEEIRSVLEAVLEDEMADFDPEDFKGLEKDGRQHFGR